MDSATTDRCLEILAEKQLREPVLASLLSAIQRHLDRRAGEDLQTGAVLFSNQYGLLGMTRGGEGDFGYMEHSKKLGTFYGVGVGPGDPELLTLKAVRVLEACPVLAAPQTASGEMTALSIARQAADLEGKTLLPLYFTMSRDRAKQQEAHRAAADAVRPYLEAGQDVAMAILGDVSIFSTYCYLMDILKAEGFPCVMVPGVPSFCAVAARLGRSLTEANTPLHILPGGGEGPGETLDLPGSKILMKSGKNYPRLLEELERRDWLDRAGMVENCGLPGERVFSSLKEKPESSGYFTTIRIVFEGWVPFCPGRKEPMAQPPPLLLRGNSP